MNRASIAVTEKMVRIWSCFSAMASVLAVAGCKPSGTFDGTRTLGKVSNGTIIVEEWHTNSLPFSIPVWLVFLEEHGSSNKQHLFSVEKVFQEAWPGYPKLVVTDGSPVIMDEVGSYVFSLKTGGFITNGDSSAVRMGKVSPKPAL
jgi:hypothetical protein